MQIHNFITGGTSTAAESSKGKYQLKLDSLVEFDLTRVETHRCLKEFMSAIKAQIPPDAKVAIVVDASTSSLKIIVDRILAALCLRSCPPRSFIGIVVMSTHIYPPPNRR